MNDVINAKSIDLKGSRVVFDTNIWLLIFDFNAHSVPHKMEIYSDAYGTLLKNGNTIVVNDYILGEFCNRCTRIEYDVERSASEQPDKFPSYKEYRKTKEFRNSMEAARDTCLNIVDDHEFISIDGDHYNIREVLDRFCGGEMDFSDIILTDFCRKEDLYLMTDDRDFANSGIKLITANRRLIKVS